MINVKAIRGDDTLGEYHFDLALADYLFLQKSAAVRSFSGMPMEAQYSIRRELERARKRLSTVERCNVVIALDPDSEPTSFTLARSDVERATAQVLSRTLDLCQEAINAAHDAGVDRIDDVILSGGMTYTPFIRNQVKEFFFGADPKKQPVLPPNPSTLVCEGAAIYAGMLMGRVREARIGERVTPFSYGIDAHNGYAKDKNIYLSVIIQRDERIFDREGTPQRFSGGNYVTIRDGQTKITSQVLQSSKGKSDKVLASECVPLGSFQVMIETFPSGQNGINVTFLMDKNGILEVEYYEIKNMRNRGIKRFNMLLRVDTSSTASV